MSSTHAGQQLVAGEDLLPEAHIVDAQEQGGLAGILRLEFTGFQLNDHVAAKVEVIEKQVNIEIVAAHVQVVLISQERKAGA